MATFAVKFLGCKVSQADAMLARSRLLAAGHEEAPEAEAELHVINTCCITREAEAKSRQAARRSAREGHRVLATGCATNLNAGQFDEIGASVTALVGTADDVAEQVAGEAGPGCIETALDPLPMTGIAAGRTRGFVKVQDGCDCHCAYCIIPKVRGGGPVAARERGRPRGPAAGRAGSAGDGHDRHLGGRLSGSRVRHGSRRADARGRRGRWRSACAALLRGGDPPARRADRRAGRGAGHLPPPARAAPVGRRRRARGDGPQLRLGHLPADDRACT